MTFILKSRRLVNLKCSKSGRIWSYLSKQEGDFVRFSLGMIYVDFILANYIMVHDGEMGFLGSIYKYARSTTPSLLKPKS